MNNQISLTTQIPFSKVYWEFLEIVRMKRQRRRNKREARSSEAAYWRVVRTRWLARTDPRSSLLELVWSDQRACDIYGWRVTCLFTGSPPSGGGVNRKRHRDWVYINSGYFDEMQMYAKFSFMTALRWDNLWSFSRRGWQSSLFRHMKTLLESQVNADLEVDWCM